MASRSSVAIVGGAGALGSALVSAYARAGWHAVSIDFTSNGAAHESILLDASAEPSARVADMIGKASTSSVPAEGSGFSAVINAAGSWAGGGVEDADLMDSVENMWGANLVPSVGGGFCRASLSPVWCPRSCLAPYTGRPSARKLVRASLCAQARKLGGAQTTRRHLSVFFTTRPCARLLSCVATTVLRLK